MIRNPYMPCNQYREDKKLISHELLQRLDVKQKAIDLFLPYLNRFAPQYDIDTPQRISAFLAQIIHESGHLKYIREIWGNTYWQKRYERDFTQTWSATNERNRTAYNLGNSQAGDGKYFMGRGLIQITGRTNYKACSQGLFGDDRLLSNPSLLEAPEYAVHSAFWWCVKFAKLLDEFDTKGIEDETRRINGSKMLGLDERKRIYNKCLDWYGV